jgi:hypothetical protein
MSFATVDPANPPAHIGDCFYCELKLYADQPFVSFPDGQISHVACETDGRRRGDSYQPGAGRLTAEVARRARNTPQGHHAAWPLRRHASAAAAFLRLTRSSG